MLATDRCHVLDDPWGDRAIALRFEDPTGAAAALAAEARVDGIVAVGDRPAYIAALAAERMGIPYNSPDSVAASRNKFLARERFRAAGLLVPDFHRVSRWPKGRSRAAQQARYPCVLKPLGLSASRGVIRANDPAEFVAAFRRIESLLADPDIARLHEDQDRFLQVESLSKAASSRSKASSSKGSSACWRFSTSPIRWMARSSRRPSTSRRRARSGDTQDAIVRTTQAAVKALGLTDGPIHAEMRVNSARRLDARSGRAAHRRTLCARAYRDWKS